MSIHDNNASNQFQKRQSFVDNDPKQIIMWWFQEIVLDFFKKHLMAYLDSTFVNKQAFRMDKYKQVMESKFLVELNGFLEYTKFVKFNMVFGMVWL